MAAPRATRGRRRRDGSLGQVPLSSGEIELYSRQDEAARRRHRLLAVREQERRLAQQVTLRYRHNLQKLQYNKSKKTHKQLSLEQHKMLTELHVRYQNSLQNMGTAQRNARLKLLELMEQAQEEKNKWTYNRQITGKQRVIQAEEAQEEEEKLRTARRRQVEQNMERLRVLSGQQRQQASAKARKEQEVAMQRAKDREEVERLRRMQSPEEVFVTPRPHEKDVSSYQFTRTHCLVTPMPEKERPAVKVIRHNRKHPTAMRGEDEAKKYRDEMDLKRERDRLVVEEQQETAAERGKSALEDATSRQLGQQAMEWLALVDKMERRTRGQEMGAGDDYPLNVGKVDGEIDDPERMAERVFARMLGLDEDSVELSAFSVETDDDQSVGLADTDHENFDLDKVADGDVDYRVKLKSAKHSGSFGSPDGIESRKRGTDARDEQADATAEKPFKATTFGDLQREEFEKLKKAKDAREKSVLSEDVEVPLKPRAGKYEDKLGKPRKIGHNGGHGGNLAPVGQHLLSNSRTMGANAAATNDRDRRRYSYGDEERPEGTDSEEDELDHTSELKRDDYSIERLENRLQEVLDLRLSRPRQDRPVTAHQTEDDRSSLTSGFGTAQRVSQHDGVSADGFQRNQVSQPLHGFSNASDGSGKSSAGSVYVAFSESGRSSLSLAAVFGNAAPAGPLSTSVDERYVAHDDDLSQSGRLHGRRFDSAMPMDQQDMYDIPRESSSPRHPGGEPKAHLRDDSAGVPPEYNGQLDTASDHRLGSSAASSRESNRTGHYQEEHGHDEAGRKDCDNPLKDARSHDAVAPQGTEGPVVLDRDEDEEKTSPVSRDHGVGRLPRQVAQKRDTDLSESRQFSASRRARALADKHDERSSSSSIAADDEEFYGEMSAPGVISIDEDQRSVSESSFAPSQKSLSRLDQVVNARAKSLGQRLIDQHMMSFSSSEGHSDDEGEAETEAHRPSTGNNDEQPSANINPYDAYRQQIDHQVRRSSTSAVSVAQYSLPPSDTQSSFDESFDRLHPGYGDDSFVNELVPMFPKRTLPPPPQSLEEDSQVLEEYDVQLVAPNMSRMLTSERRTSFGRSRQHLVRYEPQPGPPKRSRRQSASVAARRVDVNDRTTRVNERSFSSSSGRSSSVISNSEMDAGSNDTSVEQSPVPQRPVKQTRPVPTMATESGIRQQDGRSQVDIVEHREVDNRSDISSESGVSSLGFAVQLNLVAGTTRRRNNGDDRRDVPSRGDQQQRKQTVVNASDGELDNESIASERSFASSSSMSMDAHFNYLANMTSAVGKSLPLHLRIPAVIYGKKDMTKPPAPMAWSESSVSSIVSASEAGPDEASGRESHSARRSIPRSNSSISESLLEEQLVPPPVRHKMDQQGRDSDSQKPSPIPYRSEASDGSSDSESTGGAGEKITMRLTFDNIKKRVSQLPPPPLGSLNMRQPPAPMQNFGGPLDESRASSEQYSDDLQSSERSQMPPLPLGSLNMSQPPPHYRRGSNDSQSSSEQNFGDARRHANRHPYVAEEERKQDDSSSKSSDASYSSSSASSRRQSVKKAEKIVIPVKKSRGDHTDGSNGDPGMSLSEAFQRRHPGFGHRVESHRDKLKRQRDMQRQEQEHQIQQQSEKPTTTKPGTMKKDTVDRSAADDLPPEKQELLNRLASGSRAKISSREMKERSRRLYHQLPEVVERKRQEEAMRRRRERLNELREQEKERRLQQKQRRQQRR